MPGARTPEELETLFEDACVLHDREALAQLFESEAVLSPAGSPQARGRNQIERFVTEMWNDKRTYLANPEAVLQANDTALVLSGRAINVARRGHDGAWRYAILFLGRETARTSPPWPGRASRPRHRS